MSTSSSSSVAVAAIITITITITITVAATFAIAVAVVAAGGSFAGTRPAVECIRRKTLSRFLTTGTGTAALAAWRSDSDGWFLLWNFNSAATVVTVVTAVNRFFVTVTAVIG